jgi:HPt (histidine-containing phosphotransfer) domain-containing protein
LIDDLRSRFLPRFVETAKSRLARARALFDEGEADALARELHGLAGEARMLDLRSIVEEASRGEMAARAWSKGTWDGARAACAAFLDGLSKALARPSVSPEKSSEGTPP